MTVYKQITRTVTYAVDREIGEDAVSIINTMLKDMGVGARFSTEQQNSYLEHKAGCLITLDVSGE